MKKKKLNKLFLGFAIIISCFFSACKRDMPKGIIQPAEMEALLYDYHMAKTMAEELPYNQRYQQSSYLNYVFEKHHTTEAEFDSSMVWYTRHTEELNKIYENISKRFTEQKDNIDNLVALRDNKPKITQPGDSVNVWYGNKMVKLTHFELSNKLNFSIPSDSNFKEKDALLWKVRFTFLPEKKDQEAVMALSMVFDNDSIISTLKKVTASGVDSVYLRSDSTYKIKEINGFVCYSDTGNIEKKALLLDQIRLIRYRVKEDSLGRNENMLIKSDSIKFKKELEKESVKLDTVREVKTDVVPVRKNPQDMNHLRPHKNTKKNLKLKK